MISGTKLFTIFQSGWNNGVKLWAFDKYSEAFQYKVTLNIDFTDEIVVQCDGNLQMIRNEFWCEYLWVAYVLFLDPFLYLILVSSETEAYNIRSWLHENI